jgi:hypothetical protein
MGISTSDFETALLKIFARLRIPINGKLAHATLVKEWAETHLRYNDLSCAIRGLVGLNVLKEEHAIEGESLQLTPCGFARAMELRRHNLKHWLNATRLRLRLLLARSLHSPGLHHRHSD